MRQLFIQLFLMVAVGAIAAPMSSPNGKITVTVDGHALKVCYGKQQVLDIAEAGVDATAAVTLTQRIKTDYHMLTGKRSHCTNEANEYQIGTTVLRVYNDGIAFRTSTLSPQPSIAYRIPEGTRRWMQQWCDSYEGFFPLSTTYKVAPVPSYSGTFKSAEGWNNRWGYPALLESLPLSPSKRKGEEAVYVLISEANIEHGQSASCLYNDGELFRVVPDQQEPLLSLERSRPAIPCWDATPASTLSSAVWAKTIPR